MSFATQNALSADQPFQRRLIACCTQQADIFKDDARADIAALADSILRVEPTAYACIFNLAAAAPGFADEVDPDGDGTVDSDLLTDGQLLSTVQAIWPTVAGLFFDDAGAPIP